MKTVLIVGSDTANAIAKLHHELGKLGEVVIVEAEKIGENLENAMKEFDRVPKFLKVPLPNFQNRVYAYAMPQESAPYQKRRRKK